MEKMALKCEICGSTYKESVVNELMVTLAEVQNRQISRIGLEGLNGASIQILDPADARIRPAMALALGAHAPSNDPETAREAQERMQAFIEELLQFYVCSKTFITLTALRGVSSVTDCKALNHMHNARMMSHTAARYDTD
jgi:hypothetical protein